MINIITALGTPILNNELKKNNEFNVIGKDILYFEGILESLDQNINVDYIIIGENFEFDNIDLLVGEILKINKKIKIIAIINKKNIDLENYLTKKGIVDIFYDDTELDEIIGFLKTKNIEFLNIELRAEINNLKKLIEDKKGKKIFNIRNNHEERRNIIIGVTGPRGVGKTSFCLYFSYSICTNKKILIIDFDLINSQFSEIFDKRIEYSKINKLNIKELIYKINDNIDILIGFNLLYFYRKMDFNYLKNEIDKLKMEYDYVVVDTNFDICIDHSKLIFNMFDKIILISKLNRIEFIKSKKIIDIIDKKWQIENKKINIFYSINGLIDALIFKKIGIKKLIKNYNYIRSF